MPIFIEFTSLTLKATIMALIFKLYFLHLSLAVLTIHGHSTPERNTTQLEALLSFKAHITDDPFQALASWNETNTTANHFCSWLGVTCGHGGGYGNRLPKRVTGLSLPSFNLSGMLSPYLTNLTFLHTLDLSKNKLNGPIPSDIGRLSRLRYLDLRLNLLQEEIPPSLTYCTKLTQIFLKDNNLEGEIPNNFSHMLDVDTINFDRNQLSGAIPASLGLLPKLYLLALGLNQLTGNIPLSLGNLSSLAYLDLVQNNLQGCIPSELGKLTSLKWIALTENRLSDAIPLTLFNLSSVFTFSVGSNNLSGILPPTLGTTLPLLQNFQCFYNQIGGPIPTSLPNATGLQKFVLHGNMFVGRIPRNLGLLVNLTALSIGRNQLEAREAEDWFFLTSLSNCSKLSVVSLSRNKLQGLLPSSVANLSTQLTSLDMDQNQISGTIPHGIDKYNRLAVLDFSTNLLTGTIPSTVGALPNLHLLYLLENQLNGEIPASIGNLSQLLELRLEYNDLQGNIPTSIGNLFHLDDLTLSNNKLNGTIPAQILSQLPSLSQNLDLSDNLLTGALPSQIGNLINLDVLDVSENQLSGIIPASLGSCQLLGTLYMQGNFFSGIIPLSLSGLGGLQELDLSRNNLSGPIPEFLENFHNLYYLNLSFNNLGGRVPSLGVFRNASAISILGNYKLCGGDPELHLQQCDHVDGKRTHRSPPLRVMIPVIVAAFILASLIIICLACCVRKKIMITISPPLPSSQELFRRISYSEVHKATNGFSSSNLIGEGSFGSVYKGIMNSDPNQVVAIKVLKLEQRGAVKSFMAECDSLRFVRHRNLVNIVTICSSVDSNGEEFRALIYEYMPNGSLDEWLHPRVGEANDNANLRSLSLIQRWNIVMDVALALDYLHHHCETPIVHCDLKPSNVLLDEDMSAHIGDFGLSRFLQQTFDSSHVASSSLGIKGSIGYIAPEYGMGGSVTTHGDVFSYGVLLLEIFTGKRPTDEIFQGGLDLQKYVQSAYPDRVLDAIDPSILNKINNDFAFHATDGKEGILSCMVSIIKIGLLCTHQIPNRRLGMQEVIKELLLVKKILD